MVNDSPLNTLGTIRTEIQINDILFETHFFIIHEPFNLCTDGLLGNSFLHRYFANISFSSNTITISYKKGQNQKTKEICNEKRTLDKKDEKINDMSNIEKRRERKKRNNDFDYYKKLPANYFNDESKFCSVAVNAYKFKNEKNKEKSCENKTHNEKDGNLCIQKLNYSDDPDDMLEEYIYPDTEKRQLTDPNERAKYLIEQLDLSHLNKTESKAIKNLLFQYPFAFHIENDDFKPCTITKHKLQLKENSKVVNVPQYRIAQAHIEIINEQIRKLEENNIVKKCVSPYNAPIIVVPKKSETNEKKYRVVFDFRRLNDELESFDYPLPRIDEIIDQLHGSKYFTTIDIFSAFHQIELEESSKPLTAFSTPWGKYCFNVTPFGLKTSPMYFLICINAVLEGLLPNNILVYMDDIIIYSRDLDTHIRTLEEVFKRFIKHNLKASVEKTIFLKDSVKYLGFLITTKGVAPDPTKVECIVNFPRPQNVKSTQRLLGLYAYYRRFLHNASLTCSPLYELLKKGKGKFVWTDECEKAFIELKKALTSSPILAYPNFNETFIVSVDSSIKAIGGVLSQAHDKPIHYFSKTLNSAQTRYSTIERELLAIIYSVLHFSPYLIGREFILNTDHKPLVYLFNSKNNSSRLHRWRLILMGYQFKIQHKPGKNNIIADILSRLTNDDDNNENKMIEHTKTHNINVVQTRAKTKQKQETYIEEIDLENRYSIPENNGLMLYAKNNDHIFFLFEHSDCELQKKIQHKLKIKINFNQQTNQYIYPLGSNRTIVKITPLIRSNEQINQIKTIINTLIQYCYDNTYKNIAINSNFEDYQSYFNFKQILQQLMVKTNIETVLFLNKIIEIEDKEIIDRILYTYHKSWLGSHSSYERMLKNIKKCYLWNEMNKQIKQYVKNCAVCEKIKINRYIKPKMMITSTATEPFEKMFLDIVGPITPQSVDGYNYILTAVCDLTKFAIAVPLKNADAISTANSFVNEIVLKYGFVKTIVSDLGSNFISSTMKEVTKLLHTKQKFTTSYHPQSNGTVERFHKTLATFLRAHTQKDPDYWCRYLNYALFSYNAQTHSSTMYSPFELLYSRPVLMPKEILNDSPIYNYESYANEVKFKLKALYELAREHIAKRKEDNKRQYDKNALQNEIQLEKNQLVLVIKVKKKGKYDEVFNGPYRVEKMLSPNVALVRIKNKSVKINISRLKIANADYGETAPPRI